MAIFNKIIGFSGGDEADGIMKVTVTEDGYKFIKEAAEEIQNSKYSTAVDIINYVSVEYFAGNLSDLDDETSDIENLPDWEIKHYCKLVNNEAELENGSFYITADIKYSSSRICSKDTISLEELDEFFEKVAEKEEHYCNFCAMEVEIDEKDNCFNCGNPIGQEITEKDEEIKNLAYENKMMAKALEKMGFTQDQITAICYGSFDDVPTAIRPVITEDDVKAHVVANKEIK